MYDVLVYIIIVERLKNSKNSFLNTHCLILRREEGGKKSYYSRLALKFNLKFRNLCGNLLMERAVEGFGCVR
jgi:hypothetical protein